MRFWICADCFSIYRSLSNPLRITIIPLFFFSTNGITYKNNDFSLPQFRGFSRNFFLLFRISTRMSKDSPPNRVFDSVGNPNFYPLSLRCFHCLRPAAPETSATPSGLTVFLPLQMSTYTDQNPWTEHPSAPAKWRTVCCSRRDYTLSPSLPNVLASCFPPQ